MNLKRYFITGIGTNVGKTIAAAIVTEALRADYWKPVQAGDLDKTDTLKVQSLISNSKTNFHPETYRLQTPASPHAAALIDGIEISIDKFEIPATQKHLVIEGAGGLMVPLNQKHLIIDLIEKLEAEVILISQNYLGSINHTLLSLAILQSRNIPIKGIIFNGDHTPLSESFILNYSRLPNLLNIDYEKEISQDTISYYAQKLLENKML